MITGDSDASKKFYRTVIILKPFLFDYKSVNIEEYAENQRKLFVYHANFGISTFTLH